MPLLLLLEEYIKILIAIEVGKEVRGNFRMQFL